MTNDGKNQKEEEHHLSTRASCLTYSLSHLIFRKKKNQQKPQCKRRIKKPQMTAS